MENEVEFAIRELAASLRHLISVFDRNLDEYNQLPETIHEALETLERRIANHDWEVKR